MHVLKIQFQNGENFSERMVSHPRPKGRGLLAKRCDKILTQGMATKEYMQISEI